MKSIQIDSDLNEPGVICAEIKNENDTCMYSNQSDHLLTDFTDESLNRKWFYLSNIILTLSNSVCYLHFVILI
jgi:hypothetical protein